MKFLTYVLLTVALIVMPACGNTATLDGSSDESIKQSIVKVREALPESRRADFNEALKIIAFSQVDVKNLLVSGADSIKNVQDNIRVLLHGKTGEQVIAEASRIKSERKLRERKQALEEIRELEEKRVKSESENTKLKKFQVIRSRFYMKKREYGGKQPIIALTVKNGAEQAVSRAYFEGTLASPNRSVPWHKDTFSYSISGGLEPGEEASWKLAPNMFSDWGNIDAPADAVFTVTVTQIDGPDGEPLYSVLFSSKDQKRLSELKKQYGIN